MSDSDIHWSEIETRKLSDLTHWSINPRSSDHNTRERLRLSKRKFDQTYPLLIGPGVEYLLLECYPQGRGNGVDFARYLFGQRKFRTKPHLTFA